MPDIEVGELWSEMLRQKPTVFITFKEFDVNYFLSKTMKGGGKSEGTFAHFEPGLVTVATQRSVLGLSICNSASFTPARDGVKWKADVSRFAIGRLTVPSVLAKLIGLNSATLGAFAKTFDKDIQRLDRLEKIESGEGSISFTTKPQQ
jgi:hypothetical protein